MYFIPKKKKKKSNKERRSFDTLLGFMIALHLYMSSQEPPLLLTRRKSLINSQNRNDHGNRYFFSAIFLVFSDFFFFNSKFFPLVIASCSVVHRFASISWIYDDKSVNVIISLLNAVLDPLCVRVFSFFFFKLLIFSNLCF